MSVYVTLDMVFPPLLKDEVVFWQCFFRLGNYPLPRTGICGLILQYSVGRQWVDYIARAACGFISTEGGILVVKRPDPHFQPFTQVSVFGMRGLLMVIPAVPAPRGLFWALSVVLSEKEPRWLSDGLPAQCSLTQTSAFRVCLQPLAISEWFGNESLTDTSVSYLEWHVDSPLATWERRKKYGIIIWYHCHMISVFFNLPYFT